MAIKHAFTSAKSDGADDTLVRPSNWNADHTIDDGTVTNAMLAGSIALTKLAGDTTTALGVGTVELGHASDTTLSRSAAGRLAVEGVDVVTTSSTDTLTNKTLTSPTLTTPTLGAATATSVNKVAFTAPASGATLTLADGSTLATSGAYSTTLTATAATSVTLPTTGTLATLAGSETLTNKTLTSPTMTTPTLGAATATTINKVTITAPASGSTLTIADGKTLTASNTLTFTGTDSSSVAFGAGGTVVYVGAANAFTGANTFTNSTGQIFRQSANYDGVLVRGRSGGSSSYTLELIPATLTASRTATFPDASITVVGEASTQTLTNKRIEDRVTSNSTATNPTPDVSTTDIYELTAASETLAFQNPSGTPVNGQKLLLRIKDNGTQRSLTWTSSTGGYIAGGVALPANTTAGKWMHLGFIYNSNYSGGAKWMLIASAVQA